MVGQETDICDGVLIFILLSEQCDKMQYCLENMYMEFNTITSSRICTNLWGQALRTVKYLFMAQVGQALEDQVSPFPLPFLTWIKQLLLKNLKYLAKILKIELVET